jgi:hypothetical protein
LKVGATKAAGQRKEIVSMHEAFKRRLAELEREYKQQSEPSFVIAICFRRPDGIDGRHGAGAVAGRARIRPRRGSNERMRRDKASFAAYRKSYEGSHPRAFFDREAS